MVDANYGPEQVSLVWDKDWEKREMADLATDK